MDFTALDSHVAKFRTGSPNIAKAFDEVKQLLGTVDARLVALETPPPVPAPVFGGALPPLLDPQGAPVEVGTLSALQTELGGNSPWIKVTAALSGTGDLLVRRPVTIDGLRLSGMRVLVQSASRVLLRDFDLAGSHDGVKIEGGSSTVELYRGRISDTRAQGVLVPNTGQERDIRIRSVRFSRCGTGTGSGLADNQRHAIYLAGVDGFLVENVLVEDPQAYGLHFYPSPTNGLVTATTVRGGRTRGGAVYQASNIATVGYVCEDAPADAVLVYNGTGCEMFDSVEWRNGSGFGSGMSYANCVTGDPATVARGLVQPDRYRLLPATDIDGRTRATPDAGCFAL